SPLVLGGTGGGVRVAGVARATQPVLAAELRRADAQVAADGARLAFREALAGLIGDGNGEGSLSDGIARLSAALVEASNRPDSTTRLTAAVSAAAALAGQLNAASGAVQQARMEADARIGEAVGWLNAALGQVHDLNAEITRLTGTGRDAAGLL